ncbi:hypothetical protein Tco_0847712 [Tanacetum coccineum]
MSPGNMCHGGTHYLTEKYVGPTLSLGIVAGERIPSELSPANIPQRLVARERYYRIHISQLFVIAAAKVSHFEIMCRVRDYEPTVGLFRYFYVNSKNKGWMSFSKRLGHDAVSYTKPLDSLKEHYASLVAYPALFHKYPKPFLCLVGISRYYTQDENTYPEFLYKNEMDLLTFIPTADPTKVRIGERQRGDDEPKLLDTTVGRVVPLLPVAPARGESELEDSVDRLFDEEGNDDQAKQGDSASGGQGVGIQPVSEAVETNIGAKKLRKDHGIPVGTSVSGKSMPVIQRLLVGAVQNAAVRGEPVPSLPFVTSSVSTTPEREDERHTDTLAWANLETVTAPQRFVISSDPSHHSGTHIAETEVDSLIRSSAPAMTTTITVTITAGAATVVKEAVAKPSLFATGSSSVGGTESIPVGFSDLTGNDFLVGDIRTVIDPDLDLQKVYVSRWNVTNRSRLDDNQDCREMVDEFAPPKFFTSVRGMEHGQLFAEFNVGAAR